MTLTAYKIKDICNLFDVHEQTVLRWIHSGELRAVNVGRDIANRKPRWRVTQDALESFEALRAATPEPRRSTRRRKNQQSDGIEFIK